MKIAFYCKIDDPMALSVVDFYRQDIEGLKRIDPEMSIATKWKDINWSADVIFVWWWTYAFIPVLLGRLLRKKVIITGTFNYNCKNAPIDYFRRPWWQRQLIKFSTKYASKNIFVSKNEYAEIVEDWKLKNAVYSPHGIYTDIYKLGKEERENFLFSMIWTGKLNMIRKCLPQILETAQKLKADFPDFKILIGGRKGDGYDSALKMIHDLDIENYVVLLGEISEEDKIKYYQTCKIYLQPSIYEGFGLAMAEAMSSGALVISSKTGEVENVVGDAGILLEGYDSSELFETIKTSLKDKNLADEKGKKAAERIRSIFPVERRWKKLSEILNSDG